MSDAREQKLILEQALKLVIEVTPRITRGVINASQVTSRPAARREADLQEALGQAKLLVGELKLLQRRLGWERDAA